jgi:hypothetical protein
MGHHEECFCHYPHSSSTFNAPLQLLHHFRFFLISRINFIYLQIKKQTKNDTKKTSNLQLHMWWWSLEDDKIIKMDYCGIPPSMTHSNDVHEEN